MSHDAFGARSVVTVANYELNSVIWYVGMADCGYVTRAYRDDQAVAIGAAKDLDESVRQQNPVDSRALAEIYSRIHVAKGFRILVFRTDSGTFYDILEDIETLEGRRIPITSELEAVRQARSVAGQSGSDVASDPPHPP